MELANRHDPIYPESDGAPVGETAFHYLAVTQLIHVLWPRYAGQDVLIGSNQFCYYEEGEPSSVVCPDLYVVFGVDPSPRMIWKNWEEGCFPHVIIEMLSRSTSANDLGPKRQLYERLLVDEYFTFDLLSEIAPPRLRGWRRCGGQFVDIPPEPGPDETLLSERLGLLLRPDGKRLRFVDPATGALLPYVEETNDRAASIEAAQRDAEAAQRDAETAQRDAEAEQRNAEVKQRDAEAKQHDAEEKLRQAAAEATRLRKELARLRRET